MGSITQTFGVGAKANKYHYSAWKNDGVEDW
jgi:hypothetical protein